MAETAKAVAKKHTDIANLAAIELRGTSSFRSYIDVGRSLALTLASEVDWGAEEIRALLIEAGKGNPLLFGLDLRIRARRIANRLHRAAEAYRGGATELVMAWQDFYLLFTVELEKRKSDSKPTFDFEN